MANKLKTILTTAITNYTNKIFNWFDGDLVNADQMNQFTGDLYSRLTALTEYTANKYNDYRQGVILFVSGNITLSNGLFTFGSPLQGANYVGCVRFPTNYQSTGVDVGNGIFGYISSSANTVSNVSGNGYIVATYTITQPIVALAPNYTVNVVLSFVQTIPSNSVVLSTITNGSIDNTKLANYLITSGADINDIGSFTNKVALTPADLQYIRNSNYATTLTVGLHRIKQFSIESLVIGILSGSQLGTYIKCLV